MFSRYPGASLDIFELLRSLLRSLVVAPGNAGAADVSGPATPRISTSLHQQASWPYVLSIYVFVKMAAERIVVSKLAKPAPAPEGSKLHHVLSRNGSTSGFVNPHPSYGAGSSPLTLGRKMLWYALVESHLSPSPRVGTMGGLLTQGCVITG